MPLTETAPMPGSNSRRVMGNSVSNRLEVADRPAHDWYRFILSYPPHLVRHYLSEFGVQPGDFVLDPFCGTGTTLVECKKLGFNSVGVEAHPMSHFATTTKITWDLNCEHLERSAKAVAGRALEQLDRDGVVDDPQPYLVQEVSAAKALRQLPDHEQKLLLANSISPLPLHKVLVLRDAIGTANYGGSHMRLALAKALVSSISNLQFGPEVGVGPPKSDAPVVSAWLRLVLQMVDDLRLLSLRPGASSVVHHADARQVPRLIPPKSIGAVITSPPYPNEKDYTRTTRLESVLLGFFRDRQELQRLKRTMLRSNTRGVYIGDDDDQWVAHHLEIRRLAEAIEARRIELNKTSGFERLYARVTKLYFGGMARHLAELRPFLRAGARLAYVVGDQASYLRVMIRTGEILASLAEELGYVVEKIDLFRTRLSTATREQLREEVLVLRWPGGN